ncbi:hypothetical protein [Prodigiosinella confusarubida]|uniref:hypothetical protein n=1 Tax=Serratia sp. (strain ATCC 39006) TaxID=104623 RepID=UPI0012FEB075|nr:hypothetical protein [Serratia sp. ATCC 39006]
MESANVPGGKKRYQENACAAGDGVTRVSQSKVDPADEDVADGEIEKAPKYVDGRRGEPLPRWLCERALERPTHHAADEMWYGVRQKCAAKEVRHEKKPRHIRRSLPAGD